jgi:hypothetical protein
MPLSSDVNQDRIKTDYELTYYANRNVRGRYVATNVTTQLAE